MFPTIGGDIVFSAGPVDVSVLVGVASCLHSTCITLMNGWILAKHTNLSLGGGKMLIRF